MQENIFTIDFETTGVDSKTCHPVEVAVYGANTEISIFIKPPEPIPPETSAVHHIIDNDVMHSDDWMTVRGKLVEFFTTHAGEHLPILVAHNAEYEKNILLRKYPDVEDFPPVLWICTYKCALRVWPNAPSHKNEVLRYWLELGDDRGRYATQQPHSALHDTRVTYLILQELLNHATLDELVEWTELPAKLPYMPMGKHFKQPWDTIPAQYLQWCCNQVDMREDVKFCAKEELERRRKGNATNRSG